MGFIPIRSYFHPYSTTEVMETLDRAWRRKRFRKSIPRRLENKRAFEKMLVPMGRRQLLELFTLAREVLSAGATRGTRNRR